MIYSVLIVFGCFILLSMFRNLNGIIYFAFSLITAMIGKTIHGSSFWAFVDFFLGVIVWLKWIICGEINWDVIVRTF